MVLVSRSKHSYRLNLEDILDQDCAILMTTLLLLILTQVWDVRTYRHLHTYSTQRPASSVDLSGRGLLALGRARQVELWRDALGEKQKAPYLTHRYVHVHVCVYMYIYT